MTAKRKIPIIRILLCLLVLTTLASSSVFARYVSSFNASDEAKVALFDMEFKVVNAQGLNGATMSGDMEQGYSVSFTNVGQKIVIELKITNKSQVDVLCAPSLDNIIAGDDIKKDLIAGTRFYMIAESGERKEVESVPLKAAVFNTDGSIAETTSTTVILEVHSIPTNKTLDSIQGTFTIDVDVKQS